MRQLRRVRCIARLKRFTSDGTRTFAAWPPLVGLDDQAGERNARRVSAIAGIAEYSAAVANRFSIIARHRAPQVASQGEKRRKNISSAKLTWSICWNV